jgi:predicted hotdog family 3-hydroxylacyl-ACP dehydratase
MLRRVALVRTDVTEVLSASFIRVTGIGELGTRLAVTSNRRTLLRSVRRLEVTASVVPSSPILVTLIKEALSSSETSLRSVHRLLDTASVVPSSPILVTLMKEALSSSETSLRSVRRLLVTASVVPSSQILVTLMKEVLSSSETSVLTRATRRNISEDVFLHNSYCPFTVVIFGVLTRSKYEKYDAWSRYDDPNCSVKHRRYEYLRI